MQNEGTGGTPQRIEVILQTPSTGRQPDWVGAATTLLWPLALLVVVWVLRQSLAEALKGIGARAKSLSVGFVALDLGEATVAQLRPEALDDVRDTAAHTPMADSSAGLISTLNDPTTAECTVVDLGDGTEWITSRLYAVVTLVARMRGLRVMVFTASGPGGIRFVGSAPIEAVRWALASAYPWLEVAQVRAWYNTIGNFDPATLERQHVSITREGRLESGRAVQVFDAYKSGLQSPVRPADACGWVDLSGKWERAEWVTPASLTRLLGDHLSQRAVQHDFDTSAEALARRVLRFPFDYVPIVDPTGNFVRIIARRDYAGRTLRHVADAQ